VFGKLMAGDRGLLARRGPTLAAFVAAVAAVPSLRLPLLSDDWAHVAGAAEGLFRHTPYGYFRPLCAVTYWIEWQIWGSAPVAYHLGNLVLAAAAAALVVVLIRRYTGDGLLAGAAGLLFALHPYHTENVAWIAARSDLLSGLLFLWAALAYDRWRDTLRRLPVAPLILYEAAMLAKESAVILPGLLLVLGVFDSHRRPRLAEWMRGYLPLLGLGLVHFLLLRPQALGELAFGPLQWIGAWKRNLLFFSTSAILPPQTEFLEARPLLWWIAAAVIAGALLVAARAGSGRIPPVIWPAAAAFVVLLGPSLISFQQRFFFLPSAAAAVVLGALLLAAGRRVGGVVAGLLVIGWSVAAVELWTGWYTAGRASVRFMNGLVQASMTAGVDEIVVAAMPHRVHGTPVRTDFTKVLPVAGGRAVTVHSAAEIDYPTDRADALAEPRASAIRRGPGYVEVRLQIVRGRYSGYVWPPLPTDSDRLDEDWATILVQDAGELLVRIPDKPGRMAYVWIRGRFEPLY
jgi:hypothetical protein